MGGHGLMPESWEDFLLSENPQWAYFSASPFTTSTQTGYAPAQQNYWRKQFGNVWNRYLGELGSATRQEGSLSDFQDYLTDMPFTQMYYQNTSPRTRGQGRFSPTTRYMY